MPRKIVSIFEVTDYKTNKGERIFVDNGTAKFDGQIAIRFLRKQYPRLTKFVLEGFEIDGTFAEIKMRR